MLHRTCRLVGAICTALALVATSQASAAQLRGVALHPMDQDRSTAAIETEFQMLHAAGATSVRFDVYWGEIEPARGLYRTSTLQWIDWVMARARADRLKVILDVWATPCWASSVPASVDPSPCGNGWSSSLVGRDPPINPQDYAQFAAFAAKRWGSYAAALELWNEPNGYFLLSSDQAGAYAALVKAAYPAVKTVAPQLPVLMSLAGTDTGFLGALYNDGVRGFYDGIAVHPYYQPTFAGLKAFRAYELNHGDSSSLWVTEVGWSSAEYSQVGQARRVASALKQLASLPYVAAVEIYDMRDTRGRSNHEDHFGLLNFDMRPKPAWDTFATTLATLRTARQSSVAVTHSLAPISRSEGVAGAVRAAERALTGWS